MRSKSAQKALQTALQTHLSDGGCDGWQHSLPQGFVPQLLGYLDLSWTPVAQGCGTSGQLRQIHPGEGEEEGLGETPLMEPGPWAVTDEGKSMEEPCSVWGWYKGGK